MAHPVPLNKAAMKEVMITTKVKKVHYQTNVGRTMVVNEVMTITRTSRTSTGILLPY